MEFHSYGRPRPTLWGRRELSETSAEVSELGRVVVRLGTGALLTTVELRGSPPEPLGTSVIGGSRSVKPNHSFSLRPAVNRTERFGQGEAVPGRLRRPDSDPFFVVRGTLPETNHGSGVHHLFVEENDGRNCTLHCDQGSTFLVCLHIISYRS